MRFQTAIKYAARVIRAGGYEPELVEAAADSFPEYAEIAAYIGRNLSRSKREKMHRLGEWAETWRELWQECEYIRSRDPMVFYRPRHKVAWEFHQSLAFVRYLRAANRAAKTSSAYWELYAVVTGNRDWWHPARIMGPPPHSGFVITSVNFRHYAPKVFEAKMITGEPGNIIAPIFPIGGKWFYHYDERKKILQLACPPCAEADKGGSCSHTKSSIMLFSTSLGPEQLEAFSASIMNIDEDVDQEYFTAGLLRIADSANSFVVVSATPLSGLDYWGESTLVSKALGPTEENKYNPNDANSIPYVTLHKIRADEAGIVPKARIEAQRRVLTPFEAAARLDGEPSAVSDNPAFDLWRLTKMRDVCRAPAFVTLHSEVAIGYISGTEQVASKPVKPDKHVHEWTGLRVWEFPAKGAQYLIGVDTAKGVTDGDYSAATVIRMQAKGLKLHIAQVAQFWGHLNSFEYGDVLTLLAHWYNGAMAAVEYTGGYGDAVIQRLLENGYWNLYRGRVSEAAATVSLDGTLGVSTDSASKPFMISALQRYIKDDLLTVYDIATITELVAYEQQNKGKDGKKLAQPKYGGTRGHKDDRVMALAIGIGAMVSGNIYDYAAQPIAAPIDLSTIPLTKAATDYDLAVWEDIRAELEG